ncbi:MAG TPA: hypothetical protein PKC87_03435 [Candidatus Absconditabacterales bacterium]|nr:hypothetical protein [Candidatus Absconditabacterales bacterium]
MKKIIIIFLCCLIGYQGYPQNTDVLSYATIIEWTEQEIINILKEGEVLFCKYDLFLERNDTTFYIKNMELPLSKDLFFDSAYLESSISYGEDEQEGNLRCSYLIMNDRWGNQLEITEDQLVHLPILAEYLNNKIKNTSTKECDHYVPLD